MPPLYDLYAAVLEANVASRPATGATPLPLPLARDAPIFGNPLLDAAAGGFTDAKFPYVACQVGPATVQQLWQQCLAPPVVPVPEGPPDSRYRRFEDARDEYPGHLARIRAVLPAEWLDQCGPDARSSADVMAARRAAEAAVLERSALQPAPQSTHTRPWPLSVQPAVRMLTAMQTDGAKAVRASRVEAFLQEAGAPAGFTVQRFVATQAAVWRTVRWELSHLEMFWRLPLDGVGLYGSSRYSTWPVPLTCWCGQGGVGRLHCYWECPVAECVVATIAAAVHAHYPAAVVSRCALWLAEAPRAGVHAGVWRVAVLAALEAMERGRRVLWAACMDTGARLDAGGRASHAQLARACVAAVETFWALLEDYAALHSEPPKGWSPDSLPAPGGPSRPQPFFHIASDGAGAAPRLCTSPRPAEAATEAVVARILLPWNPGIQAAGVQG